MTLAKTLCFQHRSTTNDPGKKQHKKYFENRHKALKLQTILTCLAHDTLCEPYKDNLSFQSVMAVLILKFPTAEEQISEMSDD